MTFSTIPDISLTAVEIPDVFYTSGDLMLNKSKIKSPLTITRELITTRGHHMMHPEQHVCNGLACPANESIVAQGNATDNGAW